MPDGVAHNHLSSFIWDQSQNAKSRGGRFLLNWTNPGQLEPRLQPDKEYQDLSFDFKGYSLILEAVYNDSEMIARRKGVETTGYVDFFYTLGVNKNTPYCFRLIIPLERKMSFIFQLSRKTFNDDFGRGYANGTQVIIRASIIYELTNSLVF